MLSTSPRREQILLSIPRRNISSMNFRSFNVIKILEKNASVLGRSRMIKMKSRSIIVLFESESKEMESFNPYQRKITWDTNKGIPSIDILISLARNLKNYNSK